MILSAAIDAACLLIGLCALLSYQRNRPRRSDELTGLANRFGAMARLAPLLDRARTDSAVAALLIDLDSFKPINDVLGRQAGDHVLKVVAQRLTQLVGPSEVVARLSADNFFVITVGLPHADAAVAHAEQLLTAVTAAITVHDSTGGEHSVWVGGCVGVRFVTECDVTAEEVLRDADVAMARAKERGSGTIQVYVNSDRTEMEHQQMVRGELPRAIADGVLMVHYQPIVDMRSLQIQGFEALVRWPHPDHGMLAPGAFIPVAEQSSTLIRELGSFTLRTACDQLAEWSRRPDAPPELYVAVNVSARQLIDPDFAGSVADEIARTKISPRQLCLELTETALLCDPEIAGQVLASLHNLNVRLALDDFGTGYSSFSHLHSFPLDAIKLDSSFVRTLDESTRSAALVSAAIALADSLNLAVVAEGIETKTQLESLIALGCKLGQGYLFGRPASPAVAAASSTSACSWSLAHP